MAFIGNTNTTQGFTPAVDYFSGNGSTVAFTLSRPVASVAQVQATISNVPQSPGNAYTVSDNTITFTSAPPSGTNNIYVYYTSPITQVIAPGQGTVGTTQLQNGLVGNFADGSAASPSITNDGDTNTGIFFPAADTIAFSEGGVESMRIDSSGNVGIGVTPSAWGSGAYKALQIGGSAGLMGRAGGSDAYFMANAYFDQTNYKYTASVAASNYSQGAGQHAWFTAASGTAGSTISFNQAMTLDASGNLGVGATSPSAKLQVDAPNFALATSYNTLSSNFAVRTTTTQAANVGGEIALGGYTNGTSQPGDFARIHGKKENSTAGNVSGYLAFEVSNDGGPAPYIFERARITSGGDLLVGNTSFSSGGITKTIVVDNATSAGFQIARSGTVASYIYSFSSVGYRVETTSTYATVQFVSGGTNGVQLTSGATSWTSLSDETTKTDLIPITDAVNKVATLRAVTGRFKTDELGKRRSFLIAQDVLAVLPEAVTSYTEKDGTEYLGLSYTETIPLLVAAIKEQQAIIQTLTDRITALEGAK